MGIDGDGLKRCSKCKQRKDPAKDFGKHARAKDSLQTACKECYARYQAERRKDPAKKAADAVAKKRATAKRKSYYQGQRSKNKRRQRQDPAERVRWLADQREWRARGDNIARGNHTRRARKLAALIEGPLPAGTYTAIISSSPCVYCGALATTVDHIVPLARGGYEIESNLVPACGSCNSSKGAKLLTEWDQARVTRAAACSEKIALALAA